jgi:putative transposase
MPRANRYIQPGCIYHLTHRCHNRNFLLRFAKDRSQYRERLRLALKRFRVSLLGYCLTSNHTHLLVTAKEPACISRFMQKLESDFAAYYNRRKHRCGAFWGDRFHCTLVESGDHLWRCMQYIDLNMVRAGVVNHPSEWPWCGYHELIGQRRRYRLLDLDRLLELQGKPDRNSLARIYQAEIEQKIENRNFAYAPIWTRSIAIGSQSFVEEISRKTKRKKHLETSENQEGDWYLFEETEVYGAILQHCEPETELAEM